MKIESIKTLAGPNVYSHKPVLIMRLDLEALTDKESLEVPSFNERLLALLPGLDDHHCSTGRPGGFVERLQTGTYFAHVVEHVALELSEGAEIPAYFGKARYAGTPGQYNIIVEYRSEAGMRCLLETAVALVSALVKGDQFPLAERLKEARRIVGRTELGPSTRCIVEAAQRRGIPTLRVNGYSLVQLGYGIHHHYIQAAMTDRTSAIGMDVASDKDMTKFLLDRASIPVPRGVIVTTADEAVKALEQIGAPVVVKPLDGRQGKGVSLNLSTPEEVMFAFELARAFSADVLVEELFEGRNYRVLVVNGKVVAASERQPCHIVGDGLHTVAELIEIENQNPLRGEGHEKPLTQIRKDDILFAFLRKEGISMEDVPAPGEKVMLCAGINLSTGGTARDVTDEVHPDIARMCERAARVIGMDVCGVDLVVKEISAPDTKGAGGVIEINAAPGLRMHHFPSEGQARDVSAAIVDMLFPAETNGRIPIISITGTNGKTTVTRMISHLIASSGRTVGMTTTDGIWIDGKLVAQGDMTGPHSAQTVLGDSTVEVAVLETARGGIVRRGLGYDWADVGVLTNISADHIGQDGIETIEDIVHIKALIAERVRAGGTIVLNADDEQLARLTERRRVREPERRIVYCSLRAENALVRQHVAAGGLAYYLRDGWIIESDAGVEQPFIYIADVPVTLNGTAEFQIANVMAAAAAARAYGLTHEQIAWAIREFASDANNPGRANLFNVRGGYVMVDYGHNPEAFAAVCRMAAKWDAPRVTGIIGVPGDRDDSVVKAAGRIAARGFHRIIIKEDEDTRGRASGEVARLLCEAVHEEAPATECHVVLDETEALRAELQTIADGQIVVIFYDKLAPVRRVLEEFSAQPVANIGTAQRWLGAPVAQISHAFVGKV